MVEDYENESEVDINANALHACVDVAEEVKVKVEKVRRLRRK